MTDHRPTSDAARMGVSQLDTRARDLFKEIVESYLTTGEPVGSRTLSKLGASGLSPASIRNTMADLATLGLLDAPHAMAGRRPTHAGLRFFVDSFLEISDLPDEDGRAEIEARLAGAAATREGLLAVASEMLSGLAGGAGLVVADKRDAPIRHAELVNLGAGRALLVLVFEDGGVENRLLETPLGLTGSALIEATNFLNARFKGRTLDEARREAEDELTQEKARLDAAAAALVQQGLAEWSGEDPLQGRSLIVRGQAKLLQDARAEADLERVRLLFDDLEKARDLVNVLDVARTADSVRIFIGGENRLFSLSGSSLIVAPYSNAQRRIVGALGVIGPTRLNYAKIIPVVNYTAQLIGKLMDGLPKT
ncbi:MAG: heat-inducible transcriptional repressor HrcA [Caulobacterales bacterium]|jgi:heat-inducible transcriptional repressor